MTKHQTTYKHVLSYFVFCNLKINRDSTAGELCENVQKQLNDKKKEQEREEKKQYS